MFSDTYIIREIAGFLIMDLHKDTKIMFMPIRMTGFMDNRLAQDCFETFSHSDVN